MALSQVNISQDNLKLKPIPLAPTAEQNLIIKKVDKILQMINNLEQVVIQNQNQAELLLQVVLKEAFGGKDKEYEQSDVVRIDIE